MSANTFFIRLITSNEVLQWLRRGARAYGNYKIRVVYFAFGLYFSFPGAAKILHFSHDGEGRREIAKGYHVVFEVHMDANFESAEEKIN